MGGPVTIARDDIPLCLPKLQRSTGAIPGEHALSLSRVGKFSVEAELRGVKNGSVQLHKADGRGINVLVDQLSESDRQFVWYVTLDARPADADCKMVGALVPDASQDL